MNVDWMLNPITQYALIGIGFVGILYLWITAKAEIRMVRKALFDSRQSADAELHKLSSGLEECVSSG